MTIALRPRLPIRFRGRSYLALVLTPEEPLDAWFAGLDAWAAQSPGFFRTRPVVLDVSGVAHEREDVEKLLAGFGERGVRVVGLEGAKPSWVTPEMPPLFTGGKVVDVEAVPETVSGPAANGPAPGGVVTGGPDAAPESAPEPAALNDMPRMEPATRGGHQEAASLLIEEPVRSGASVFFPQGDVTVLGSVASGAEIMAGGSIHVYGALRGRAIAGCGGNPRARIFCRKMEAELLAIDGLYKTTEDLAPELRGKPIQAWLEGDAMKVAALG
ncbi:septum site-determining protein MinC [Pseudoxanthobacter sp.]|uniref:septum site-determining protein MinC n=1 Tax=Pseudoxanthobacter sp. TaxID=1925742 RepID=UPI002FDFCCBA